MTSLLMERSLCFLPLHAFRFGDLIMFKERLIAKLVVPTLVWSSSFHAIHSAGFADWILLVMFFLSPFSFVSGFIQIVYSWNTLHSN